MAQTPVDRLVELSMVPELAKEVRSQIVAAGTPFTPGSAVTDATDEATAVTQLNALLASLRAAGVIAT